MIKKSVSCGAVVWNKFENEIKILLVNFSPSKAHGDSIWGFTKGTMEKGETEVQTAVREIKEEADMDVDLDTNFKEIVQYIFEYEGETVNKTVIYFSGKAKKIEVCPQEGEINICKWCSFKEAEKLLTYECDKNIVKKFRSYINV